MQIRTKLSKLAINQYLDWLQSKPKRDALRLHSCRVPDSMSVNFRTIAAGCRYEREIWCSVRVFELDAIPGFTKMRFYLLYQDRLWTLFKPRILFAGMQEFSIFRFKAKCFRFFFNSNKVPTLYNKNFLLLFFWFNFKTILCMKSPSFKATTVVPSNSIEMDVTRDASKVAFRLLGAGKERFREICVKKPRKAVEHDDKRQSWRALNIEIKLVRL